jgi:disulfide bond formation protein DsbB
MSIDAAKIWTNAPLIVLAASASVLGAAYVAQYGFGLEPCQLCYWQRWPYLAILLLAPLGFLIGRKGAGKHWMLVLFAAILALDAGIAGFHVGVENHWWRGLESCGADGAAAQTIEDLRAQIVGRAVVRCDEPAFVFLGLSMAGWNGLIALALAGFSLAAALRQPRTR